MTKLSEKIIEYADGLPEGTPVAAKCLLHLNERPAIDKALARLTERGDLVRASRGVYLRPVTCEFGTYTPAAIDVVNALSKQRGEMIVPSCDACANHFGLTTGVPVRSIYLTSGRSWKMRLGKQVVEIRHAPRWQMTLAHKPSGALVRALAWAGPEHVDGALKTMMKRIPASAFRELVKVAPQLPTWLARSVARAVHD